MSLRVLNNEPKMAEREASVGGFSKPSKMPGLCWSISAEICKTGSRLRKHKGTVCASCYALKGHYSFPNVKAAHKRRIGIFTADTQAWVDNMISTINAKTKFTKPEQRYFRFFDAGDLQSVEMLLAINTIATNVPDWAFWVPTKEVGMLAEFRQLIDAGEVKLAKNLTIRLSAAKIDDNVKRRYGFQASRVKAKTKSKLKDNKLGNCPAYTQGGKCMDCRACWDRKIPVITYPLH